MDSIINYFETIPSLHRTLILFGGLTVLLLIENFIPFFKMQYNKTKHVGLNLFFTFTTILVNFVMAFILIKAASWVSINDFGIINWLPIPILLYTFLGLILMDLFGAYTPHWVEHHVKSLWQFHIIHHTDQHVDASTANRHHPGESIIRFTFTVLAVLIVGAPIWMVMLYQALSAIFSQFNHSNIKIPKLLNKALVWLFVTPDMHRVHHHYRQPYSDSNYGNIFSIWDRVFGTLQVVDNNKLVYGLDTHMHHDEAHNIWTMLKLPFIGYRGRIEYDNEEKLN